MSETVQFFVPGKPVAKGRAKHARMGAHVRTYTPEPTRRYEEQVKWLAHQAMEGRPPLAGPVSLRVDIVCPCPKSWSSKRKVEAWCCEIAATKKPDASNVAKAIEDGCNEVVYRDDSQIVLLTVSKRYGEQPGVSVAVIPLHARPAP